MTLVASINDIIFLAALSLSVSVCPFFHSFLVFLLVSLKFLLVLKSFNSVSRLFKGCLKFKRSFKGVYRKFQGRFKEV